TYQLVLANDLSSVTGLVAKVSVVAPPSIITQPADVTVAQGGEAVFKVVATGSPPLTYKWYYNQTNTFGGVGGDTLTLSGVQPFQEGVYNVVIANAWGTVTSDFAHLTVTSNPIIDASNLHIDLNSISLSLNSVSGTTYQLEYKNALTDASWVPVEPPIAGTGSPITLLDTNTPFASTRFYRVSAH